MSLVLRLPLALALAAAIKVAAFPSRTLCQRASSRRWQHQLKSNRDSSDSLISLGAGAAGLAAVIVNRVTLTPYLYDSQARSDLLAVIAAGGLILQGVYLLVR